MPEFHRPEVDVKLPGNAAKGNAAANVTALPFAAYKG